MLFLRDIQVVLNPDSNFRAVVPILLTTPIDVDLGTLIHITTLLFISPLSYSYHHSLIHIITLSLILLHSTHV